MRIFVKTLTGKTPGPWPDGCISDQFPTRGTRLCLGHDKSPPRTTSLRLARQVRLQLVHGAQTHNSGVATDAHEWANLHVTRKQQLAAMQATCPSKSLNAGLTSRATITSPSPSTLPHARLNPRHSSTLYDAHKPSRLGRGKLGKHSCRLRQALNYSGRRPSVPEGTIQPGHAAASPTRHRDSASAPRQTATYDGTCQLPNTVTLFYPPLVPLPLRL
jgi:hypothetical protein